VARLVGVELQAEPTVAGVQLDQLLGLFVVHDQGVAGGAIVRHSICWSL
jgi:hypothetical protein